MDRQTDTHIVGKVEINSCSKKLKKYMICISEFIKMSYFGKIFRFFIFKGVCVNVVYFATPDSFAWFTAIIFYGPYEKYNDAEEQTTTKNIFFFLIIITILIFLNMARHKQIPLQILKIINTNEKKKTKISNIKIFFGVVISYFGYTICTVYLGKILNRKNKTKKCIGLTQNCQNNI